MKLFTILVTCLICQVALAEQATLIGDGRSDYSIVIAAQAMPANVRAAHELQSHLKQMSGVELPIVDDSKPQPARAILVGPSKFVDAKLLDKEKLGNDGFVIKSDGPNVIIAGPGPRGSMYGVSEFLEELGVRWFTQTVTVVPKRATVTVDALDVTQVPAFEYREPYFTEAFDKDWAARNRVIGASEHLDASTGGTISYADFVHTLDHLVPQNLYAKHPEYFPMVGGKRINGYVQRCLSNPDVLKLAIAGVEKAFKEHPDAVITSVSQNDTDKWCECDKCKALAAKYGGQSGVYIWFVNQVADQIEKDLGPDKLIDTLAYQFTEPAPKNISPRKNVRVRICPINVCQGHPYESDDYPASKAFMQRLSAWGKLTDTMYIWAYCTDFAHYLLPFPDFDGFPSDIRMFKKNGVRGVFYEGAYAGGGGGSDAELRSYVMAKLLWNPDLDSENLINEWMDGVYGKAAKPMRAWFDLLHQQVREKKIHFTCYPDVNVAYLTDDVMKKGDALFDEAEKLASGDETASKYVAKSRLWLRYPEVMRHKASPAEVKKFADDCRKFGITAISEGQALDAWERAHSAGK